MTAELIEETRILDTAGLCADFPQLAVPYKGWDCVDEGAGSWRATRLPQFPLGWLDDWDSQVAGEALAAERMHWETVNGTLPQAHPMLQDDEPELEPLPDMPEHGWLTRMGDELGADDEHADAAVTSFMAVHDEQGENDDWAFEDEGDGEMDGRYLSGSDVLPEEDAAPDDEAEPEESELDPLGEGRFRPFDGDHEGDEVA